MPNSRRRNATERVGALHEDFELLLKRHPREAPFLILVAKFPYPSFDIMTVLLYNVKKKV